MAVHATNAINIFVLQCDYLKKETGYEAVFVAAHPSDGDIYTGTALGCRFVQRDNMALIRNFQYAVGGKGMFMYIKIASHQWIYNYEKVVFPGLKSHKSSSYREFVLPTS